MVDTCIKNHNAEELINVDFYLKSNKKFSYPTNKKYVKKEKRTF
jgi:hypothetical protein